MWLCRRPVAQPVLDIGEIGLRRGVRLPDPSVLVDESLAHARLWIGDPQLGAVDREVPLKVVAGVKSIIGPIDGHGGHGGMDANRQPVALVRRQSLPQRCKMPEVRPDLVPNSAVGWLQCLLTKLDDGRPRTQQQHLDFAAALDGVHQVCLEEMQMLRIRNKGLENMQALRLPQCLSELPQREVGKHLGDPPLPEEIESSGQLRRPGAELVLCFLAQAVRFAADVNVGEPGQIRWLSVVSMVADDRPLPAKMSQKETEFHQDIAPWLVPGAFRAIDLVISREHQDGAVDLARQVEQPVDGDIAVFELLVPRPGLMPLGLQISREFIHERDHLVRAANEDLCHSGPSGFSSRVCWRTTEASPLFVASSPCGVDVKNERWAAGRRSGHRWPTMRCSMS